MTTNQLSRQLTEWYRQLEVEWRESQEDQALTMNEVVSLFEFMGTMVFDEDYRALAEVSDVPEAA